MKTKKESKSQPKYKKKLQRDLTIIGHIFFTVLFHCALFVLFVSNHLVTHPSDIPSGFISTYRQTPKSYSHELLSSDADGQWSVRYLRNEVGEEK